MLKEIEIGSEFSVSLVSPKEGMTDVGARTAGGGSGTVAAGAGKKTLRMKKDVPPRSWRLTTWLRS